MDTLKLKKAWEIALGPAKALPMNAIMMYMSGNSLQIFSIMMVFMLFKTPLQGLVQTNSVFARFETEGTRKTLVLVKLVYVGMNLLALALGVWKVNGVGVVAVFFDPFFFRFFFFFFFFRVLVFFCPSGCHGMSWDGID
jgi:hypothetical protein